MGYPSFLSSAVAASTLALLTGAAYASVPSQEEAVETSDVIVLLEHVHGGGIGSGGSQPNTRGDCQQQSSTRANFNFDNIQPGVQATIQAGFVQGEIAAQTYAVPANQFPIRIDMLQGLLGTVSTQVTTTRYTWMVWEGVPSASNPPRYQFSSSDNGIDPPDAVIPPSPGGSQAAVIDLRFMVDPSAPLIQQMVLTNPNGANSFTIGLRIDQHNNQTGNGCGAGQVPQGSNAFPMTEFGNCCTVPLPLTFPNDNHLFAIDCGSLGCPAGWSRFSDLIAGVCFLGTCIDGCRPSGDWLLRSTWTSLACGPTLGACCLPNGSCVFELQLTCNDAGGVYQGDNVSCLDANCPEPTGACCIIATGNCLNNASQVLCNTVGGVFQGNGTTCAQTVCFPTGACCLPDGTCFGPTSPENCSAAGGSFQGNGTNCGTANCPQPTGACCIPATNNCVVFTQADCNIVGGDWKGPGTNCADNNQNGTADACESTAAPCPCDRDSDGVQSIGDYFAFLNEFFAQLGGPGTADIDGDGTVTVGDYFTFLACLEAISVSQPCP